MVALAVWLTRMLTWSWAEDWKRPDVQSLEVRVDPDPEVVQVEAFREPSELHS